MGAVHHLWDGPIERDVLGDVEPLAGLHLGAVEAQHAKPRLRQEGRGALTEEQQAGDGEAAVPHEAPTPQDTLVVCVGPEGLLVAREDLAVDVVDARVGNQLVLEDTLVLVVLERSDLLVPELPALVPLPEEDSGVLAAQDDPVRRRLDVDDEYEVLFSDGIDDRHAVAGNVGGPGCIR